MDTDPATYTIARDEKTGHFLKGVSPNPGGRPVGGMNRFQKKQALQVARSGASPLQILLAYARRDENELKRLGIPLTEATYGVQRWAILAALPYTAQRMPQQIISSSDSLSPAVEAAIGKLTDEELQSLISAFRGTGLLALLKNGHGDVVSEQGSDDD
jgi:hypothetical protein